MSIKDDTDDWTAGTEFVTKATARDNPIKSSTYIGLQELLNTSQAMGWDEVSYDTREEMQRRMAHTVDDDIDHEVD